MTRYMYDSIDPATIPTSATMVAGYADGLYANMNGMAARFPGAVRVSIAVAYTTTAQVLDVETGDATPAEAVLWCTQTMASTPNSHLTVYCNTSTWPSVRQAFQSAGVTEPQYWVAAYDGDPTIPAGAVAKQYQNTSGWDLSSVADYWPGVDPNPSPAPTPTPTPQESDMPQWNSGPVVPGAQPTVVLVPHGAAWSGAQKRTLHLGMDAIGTPAATATVRVAVHDGTKWASVGTQTVPAAGSTVDVDVTGSVKVSLQTDTPGVTYAVETW